jgi:uncharacterized protein (TIGR02996 family)
MSDRAAFLRTIRENPADDAPRLVLADWLDEHDEGWRRPTHMRAEFIRLGCQLAQKDRPGCCDRWGYATTPRSQVAVCVCEWARLYHKAHDLWLANAGWQPPGLWADCECPGRHLMWSRGFLDSIKCTADVWLKYADALLAEHPVTNVTLTTLVPFDERFSPDGFAEWRVKGRAMWTSDEKRHHNGDRRPIAEILLEAEWPGIAFTLPIDPSPFGPPLVLYAHTATANVLIPPELVS